MSDVHDTELRAAGANRVQVEWLSPAVLFNALSAVMIGFTNADRFHDGIFQSFPWSRGNCLGDGIWSGHPWSGKAFLVFFVAAALAVVSAHLAVRFTRPTAEWQLLVARVLFWGGVAQLGYWALAAWANFSVRCIA